MIFGVWYFSKHQGKEVVRTLIDRHAGTLEVSGR